MRPSFYAPSSVVLLLVFSVVLPAAAIDLEAAVEAALARDTGLAAFEARVEAAHATARADGALPDPELSLGYRDLPTDDFSTSADMMTMFMVGVSQRFPAGQTRSLRRSRGEREAEVLLAERDAHALEIRRWVRRAWLDWRFAGRAQVLAESAEARLTELVALTERRFATGTADRQELMRARLERAVLRERTLEWDAEARAAHADLTRWLDEAPDRPGAGPDWLAPDASTIEQRLPGHPLLRAATIRESIGEVGAELAREAYKPEWMVEVGYGIRRGRDPLTGDSRSDMLSGMVSVSVPLFTANRQDQRLRAAHHERAAARFDQTDLTRDFRRRQARQLALWSRYAELADLYQESLLPAAADTRGATLDAYQNDRATFDEAIRSELDEFEHRIGALRAARQRDEARLELLYLAGE